MPRQTIVLLTLLLCTARCAGAADAARIISLAPSVTETVFALGLGDRLVGVSVYCDYPPEVAKIDRVGTFLTPNLEAILAKRPDVVIALPTPGNRDSVEALRRLGLNVLVVDPRTVAEIEDSLIVIGRALGRESEGRQLVSRIEERIAAVRQRIAGVPERKVLMVVGHTPLIAAGAGTFQDELIRMARGINLAVAGGSWPHLSIEFAVASAPEVIIDTTMGNEERTGQAAAAFWAAYSTLPAVRDRRVYGTRADQLLRPGPRIGEAYETIARLIHPERFE